MSMNLPSMTTVLIVCAADGEASASARLSREAALATSVAMSTANTSACSVSRSHSYTPMTVATRRSLIDTVSLTPPMLGDPAWMRPRGPPAHVDWPRERRAGTAGSGRDPPTRAGGRERAAARGSVDGDPRPRGREAPGAGGAADRLGQVGGLLRRHRAAAGGRSGPHRDRVAAAGPDARPG